MAWPHVSRRRIVDSVPPPPPLAAGGTNPHPQDKNSSPFQNLVINEHVIQLSNTSDPFFYFLNHVEDNIQLSLI